MCLELGLNGLAGGGDVKWLGFLAFFGKVSK